MQDRETAHRLPLEFALSQLRHGYQQLHEHRVSRRGMREFADGIIAPAIRRMEQALASPLSAPPQEPTGASPQAETSANVRAVTVHICDDCLHLRGEMCHEPNCRFCRRTMVEVADYLDVLLIRPRIDGVSVLIDEGSHLPSPVSPVEPEPCVWRDDHGITRTTCGMTLPEGADDHTYCGYCGAPLKVER